MVMVSLNFLQNKPVVKPKKSDYLAYYEFLFAELSRSIEDLEAQVNFTKNDLARSKKLYVSKIIPRSDFDKNRGRETIFVSIKPLTINGLTFNSEMSGE